MTILVIGPRRTGVRDRELKKKKKKLRDDFYFQCQQGNKPTNDLENTGTARQA